MTRRLRTSVWLTLALMLAAAGLSAAQPTWQVLKPSNTGIPGEEIRFLDFARDGRLWVGARWPFWQQGGLGILDLDAAVWSDLANWETPIPSEYVNDLEFGSGGVWWLATDQGLVRNSAGVWTVYDSSNSPLLHNRIRNIDLDSDGHVWINNTNPQNQNAAVFEFDGTTWRTWAVPEIPWPDPWRALSSIHVDANDHVWVGNDTIAGLAEFDGVSWTLHGASLDVMRGITSDLSGRIWAITGQLGYQVYSFDGTDFRLFGGTIPPLDTTTCTQISVDPATGAVFIGNWVGQVVKTLDGGAHWTYFGTVTARVTGIAHDPRSDHVWVGSAGAVHELAGDGTNLRALNSYNTGLPDYFVDYMSADRDGYFWVATGEAGLSRFDGERWRNWGAHNAGSEPYPFAGNEPMGGAYGDRNGVFWFGGNGIARWHSDTGEFDGFWNWQNNPGMGVTLFPHFAEDAAGHLFAADRYGAVFRFDGSLWQTEPVAPYAPLELPGMTADHQGNVWICAWFALHEWNGASWTTIGDDWGLFDLGGANCFAFGSDGTIWIGTQEGLLRSSNGQLTLFDTSNSPLPANAIQGIAVRDDGLIGLSASDFGSITPFPNGVCVIDGDIEDPSRWSVWSYGSSPIPHYQLGRVAFDAAGKLWVSAVSEGVAVLDYGPTAPVAAPLPARGPAIVLAQNRPNPFWTSTSIDFELGAAGRTDLALYDVTGRLVRRLVDGELPAGRHSVDVDGRGLTPGVYFYRLRATGLEEGRRMTLLR